MMVLLHNAFSVAQFGLLKYFAGFKSDDPYSTEMTYTTQCGHVNITPIYELLGHPIPKPCADMELAPLCGSNSFCCSRKAVHKLLCVRL